MPHSSLAILALTLLAASPGARAATQCPQQPLPSPIDSLSPLPSHERSISFAATPTVGSRAWAVRLHRTHYIGPGSLEIVHLQRQRTCNRYDIRATWRAPLSEKQYRSLADRIAPFVRVAPDAFSETVPPNDDEIALDGTGIALSVKTPSWEVSRRLNHYGRAGGELSAVFHSLVSQRVLKSEAPRADWRPRQ